jgi:hypothetical protein
MYLCPSKCLKAGIVEAEEMVFVRQQLGKHVSAEMNTHTAEKLLVTAFSMWSVVYEVLNM